MNIKESIKIMEDRGYTINYHSPDYKIVNMVKNDEESGEIVVAELTSGDDKVELIGMTGLFILKSSKFYIRHERFKDLFEDRLIEMLISCRK